MYFLKRICPLSFGGFAYNLNICLTKSDLSPPKGVALSYNKPSAFLLHLLFVTDFGFPVFVYFIGTDHKTALSGLKRLISNKIYEYSLSDA